MKNINIGIVAHVDVGKSTFVDALLHEHYFNSAQTNDQIIDKFDLEQERGITIYSKNCSINYKNTKINNIDTPGHADFSSEAERVVKTVDTVLLLLDLIYNLFIDLDANDTQFNFPILYGTARDRVFIKI
ncbi:GTP-binding protein [Erysipelothrix urinaevulpis]|uniref:GTP-binding protein n=1 Tax=Erysipelothrix urinaevulpis TaxID=2683717 RepID=UPI00135A772B|nr:GTP-binding protein [Erysipelothrix urinaevulpis]